MLTKARAASTVTDPRLQLPKESQLAVLGSPISHSKSPAIHAAAYRELGLDWAYGRHELTAGDLAEFLSGLGAQWRGLSLTMPLKEEAHRLARVLDPVAEESGVVNTLLRVTGTESNAAWAGFNTDVGGLSAAIAQEGLDATRTVVLGAGATAVSAVLAARRLGAVHVDVLARRQEAARTLAERFTGTAESGRAPMRVSAGSLFSADEGSERASAKRGSVGPTLIISTLPGHGIDWERVPAVGTAPTFDVAYDPWPSPLAELTRSAGAQAFPGTGMLLQQALLQIRIFVNGDPSLPVDREPQVLESMRHAIGL